jgi:hypothetical protein
VRWAMENFNLDTLATYCGSISTIIALVVLIVKPLRTKFVAWITKTSDKEGINAKIDNLTDLVQKQIEQNDEINAELKKQSMALQANLRNSILVIYNSRMKAGYITIYEKENLAKLQEQYQSLGGNSFIHTCCDELNELPIKDD